MGRAASLRRTRLTIFFAVAGLVSALAAASQRQPETSGRSPRAAQKTKTSRKAGPPRPACGDLVAFQVLLAREGFSPGEIDLHPGQNLARTLSAFQAARNIPATARPDCDTWTALGGDTSGPATVTYTITDDDLNGPFTEAIPRQIETQAALPALGYRSALEELAERFHESPTLLRHMNPGVDIAAGSQIVVPAVVPFDPDAKPLKAPAAMSLAIEVSRSESALRALREDGSTAFFAPVTTGSVHDPLPLGEWQVTSVSWHPVFHYNPLLFWDAKTTDGRATIKPGPNNPVGVVWIGLNKEHYGLHGTPDPARIGHTESHGCVRLTNWDAAAVASLVTKGTLVVFK